MLHKHEIGACTDPTEHVTDLFLGFAYKTQLRA